MQSQDTVLETLKKVFRMSEMIRDESIGLGDHDASRHASIAADCLHSAAAAWLHEVKALLLASGDFVQKTMASSDQASIADRMIRQELEKAITSLRALPVAEEHVMLLGYIRRIQHIADSYRQYKENTSSEMRALQETEDSLRMILKMESIHAY